jgi:uncharacterized protein (TIGR02246 family)
MTRTLLVAATALAAIAFASAAAAQEQGAQEGGATNCPPVAGPVEAPDLDRPEGYVECIEAEERRAEIQAFSGAWATCYEAQDAACVAALYAGDALLIPADGMPLRGAAIEAYYAGLFRACEDGRSRAVTLAYDSIDAGEDRAVIIQHWTVAVAGDGVERSGRSLLVLSPDGGGWRISRQMDGDSLAPPAEDCPPVM